MKICPQCNSYVERTICAHGHWAYRLKPVWYSALEGCAMGCALLATGGFIFNFLSSLNVASSVLIAVGLCTVIAPILEGMSKLRRARKYARASAPAELLARQTRIYGWATILSLFAALAIAAGR